MNHQDQVLELLRTQIGRDDEVEDIRATAEDVSQRWVDPVSGGQEQTNGLIYGLVQSGKTGVLTVTGAIGADFGYRTLVVLTSDINPLYEQTLGRIREGFPGMDVLGKADIRDPVAFSQRLRGSTCAIVVTKNASILNTLIDSLRVGNVRGLSCLIIDDEADQASLNTRASRGDGSQSTINDCIENLRSFFDKNTYLQVTATPQALFLQEPGHTFRPQFTVLSHPGSQYVGGDDFFSAGSTLVRIFPLTDITALTGGAQPMPRLQAPQSLVMALDTFVVGGTYKRSSQPDQNCAFLCHVSTRTSDHQYIERLLRQYKLDLADGLQARNPSLIQRLRKAYDDLSQSHAPLRKVPFDDLLEKIEFFSHGIAVKLVNGQTDEDVAVRSPLNLFVGGNKLGRGVTIKNLLVSYYGRNPRTPQADTVLQHARMYGYRRADIGLLRLFLPQELHTVFRAIHRMETGLRDLIQQEPGEEFRGVYVEGSLSPTRRNVLVPGAIGAYTGGSWYNPAQIMRDTSVAPALREIDELVRNIRDKQYAEVPIATVRRIIELTRPEVNASEHIWKSDAIAGSITQFASLLNQQTGYVYVDRDREVRANRRETAGIVTGGEVNLVPSNRLTLFLLRMKPERGETASWWPQLRFPPGRYAFAFAV